MAHIREYDGNRGIDIDVAGNFVVVEAEAGGGAWAFDRGLFLHQVKVALGISVILEHDEGRPSFSTF